MADEAMPAGAAPCSINRRHRLTPLMSEVRRVYAFIPKMSRGRFSCRSRQRVRAKRGTMTGCGGNPQTPLQIVAPRFGGARARSRISTYAHVYGTFREQAPLRHRGAGLRAATFAPGQILRLALAQCVAPPPL